MGDIREILRNLGIDFQEFEHAPATSVEVAEEVYKNVPGAHTKNIFLRDKKGNKHFLVIMPAKKELDPAVIRQRYDTSKLGGAMEYELEKYLGVKPGSVSPFALINDTEHHVQVVIDEDLKGEPLVHFHPLINTQSLVIKIEDLFKFLDHSKNPWETLKL